MQNQTTNPFQRLRDELETMSHWDLLFYFVYLLDGQKKILSIEVRSAKILIRPVIIRSCLVSQFSFFLEEGRF